MAFSKFISEPPKLDPIAFGNSIINEGDIAQVNCIVKKGDKPLTVRWHFDGLQLFTSKSVQIHQIGRSSILTLDPVRAKHQGRYTCVATNAAGEDSSSTFLRVNGTLL